MILLVAVVVGLAAGLLRAKLNHQRLRPFGLAGVWLAFAAVIPQLLLFNNSLHRSGFPDGWTRAILIVTQAMLLVFVWLNRREPGLWLAGLGLGANLLVIALNGGLMPISPDMVRHLVPGANPSTWSIGERLWGGKDVVLSLANTRLPWLSDWFTLPDWIPYRVAFSIGDVLVAGGIIWLLGSLGGSPASAQHRGTHGVYNSISQRLS